MSNYCSLIMHLKCNYGQENNVHSLLTPLSLYSSGLSLLLICIQSPSCSLTSRFSKLFVSRSSAALPSVRPGCVVGVGMAPGSWILSLFQVHSQGGDSWGRKEPIPVPRLSFAGLEKLLRLKKYILTLKKKINGGEGGGRKPAFRVTSYSRADSWNCELSNRLGGEWQRWM